jgi:MFS family permease
MPTVTSTPETVQPLHRRPHIIRLLIAGTLARLPLAITTLVLVLSASDRRSGFLAAGTLIASYTAGAAVGAIVQSRFIDRHGAPRILGYTAVLNATGLVGISLLIATRAPLGVTFTVGALAGVTAPVAGPCVRAAIAALLPAPVAERAFYVEATAGELNYIFGPLLVTLVVSLIGSGPAVLALAGLSLSTTFVLSRSALLRRAAPCPPARAAHGEAVAPLRVRGMTALVGSALFISAVLAASELSIVAFAKDHDLIGLVGLPVASLSVGSILGGLLIGGSGSRTGKPVRRYIVLVLLLCVATIPLVIVPSFGFLIAATLPAGFAVAPAASALSTVLQATAPARRVNETFGMIATTNVLGASLGSGTGAFAIELTGYRGGFLAAVGLGAVSFVFALIAGKRLA